MSNSAVDRGVPWNQLPEFVKDYSRWSHSGTASGNLRTPPGESSVQGNCESSVLAGATTPWGGCGRQTRFCEEVPMARPGRAGRRSCPDLHVDCSHLSDNLGEPALRRYPRACEGGQQHVVILVRNEGQSQLDQGNMWSSWYDMRASRSSIRVTCGTPGTKKETTETRL